MSGIDNNTILYLRGDSFNDLSLNPKTITNTGTVISSEGGKDCLFFGSDNTAKYLTVTGLPSMTTFTISSYIFIDKYNKNSTGSHGSIIGTSDAKFMWSIPNNGQIHLVNYSNTSGGFYSDEIMPTNRWIHIEITCDNGKYTIFKDGVKLKEVSSIVTFVGGTATIGNLGSRKDMYFKFFGKIRDFLISNTVLHTSNFTPPSNPYNSISININTVEQNSSKIDFNITKLGQETINRTELLVNNKVVQTYNEIGDLSYNIDENIMNYGNNDIKIRVIFNNDYTEEAQTTYRKEVELETFDPLGDLLPTATLNDVIQRFSVIESTNNAIINNLKKLLNSKGLEVGDSPRLSNMVKLVNELSNNNSTEITEYINRITELESEKATLNQNITTLNNTIANNKTLLYNKLVSCGATGISSSNDFQSLINSMILFESKVGKTYLYQAGNECTSVTGGWTAKSYFSNGGTTTKASKYLEYGDQTKDNYGYGGFYTTNKINLKDYRRLFIDWEIVSTKINIFSGTNASGSTQNVCGTKTSASSDYTEITQLTNVSNSLNNYNLGRRITAVDLSSQTASVHIVVHSTAGYIYTDTILCRLHNMWLEK